MDLSCSICFGKLAQSPDQDDGVVDCLGSRFDVKISAGKCGHFFHDYCIRGWLDHLRSQGYPKECPSCRTKIGNLKKLYPSFCNVSRAASVARDCDSAQIHDPDTINRSIEELEPLPNADVSKIVPSPRKKLSCFKKHSLLVSCVLMWAVATVLAHQFAGF